MQQSKIHTLLYPPYENSVSYLCLYGYRMTIIIRTLKLLYLQQTPVNYAFKNYIWKTQCHWFTITQTFSVESVTFMVNAVFTARILTIFSIGLETFWKKIVYGYRSLTISCSWNQISSKIMKCITCCTIMTLPTRLTGAHTIYVPTSFTIWWTGRDTVYTVISRFALLSKYKINNQCVC